MENQPTPARILKRFVVVVISTCIQRNCRYQLISISKITLYYALESNTEKNFINPFLKFRFSCVFKYMQIRLVGVNFA